MSPPEILDGSRVMEGKHFEADTFFYQNAMNAAEITDKLGLHSLRQRAWVRLFPLSFSALGRPTHANPTSSYSTSSPPALLPEMVCTRVSSGSPLPSARRVTSRGFNRRTSRSSSSSSSNAPASIFSPSALPATYSIARSLSPGNEVSVVICTVIGGKSIENQLINHVVRIPFFPSL